MEGINDILEEILGTAQRLRPFSFLLAHFSSDEQHAEALRSLGSALSCEIEVLEEIHRRIEELWRKGED